MVPIPCYYCGDTVMANSDLELEISICTLCTLDLYDTQEVVDDLVTAAGGIY